MTLDNWLEFLFECLLDAIADALILCDRVAWPMLWTATGLGAVVIVAYALGAN